MRTCIARKAIKPNARYWYAQAGREPVDGSLEYEREMMAKTIIEGEV